MGPISGRTVAGCVAGAPVTVSVAVVSLVADLVGRRVLLAPGGVRVRGASSPLSEVPRSSVVVVSSTAPGLHLRRRPPPRRPPLLPCRHRRPPRARCLRRCRPRRGSLLRRSGRRLRSLPGTSPDFRGRLSCAPSDLFDRLPGSPADVADGFSRTVADPLDGTPSPNPELADRPADLLQRGLHRLPRATSAATLSFTRSSTSACNETCARRFSTSSEIWSTDRFGTSSSTSGARSPSRAGSGTDSEGSPTSPNCPDCPDCPDSAGPPAAPEGCGPSSPRGVPTPSPYPAGPCSRTESLLVTLITPVAVEAAPTDYPDQGSHPPLLGSDRASWPPLRPPLRPPLG